MKVYYNEFDLKAAAWLRELIGAGLLPAGDVDERSIADVTAGDLVGYGACHFFAGIGGWPYALDLAGWGDRPVWTGSCPCQPFSAAGKRQGEKDARHVWPEFARIIRECRPPVVFGEQVEGAVRLGWLDGVFADLEGEGYACGAAVLGAHSVGAPHIRQRLYWVADTHDPQRRANGGGGADRARERGQAESGAPGGGGSLRRLADADGRLAGDRDVQRGGGHGQQSEDGGLGGRLEHAPSAGREQWRAEPVGRGVAGGRGLDGVAQGDTVSDRLQERVPAWPTPGAVVGASPWDAFALIPCRDGKSRRTQPGLFPLADGIPGRVGLLRGAGNAIVPQTAAAFVRAYLEARGLT